MAETSDEHGEQRPALRLVSDQPASAVRRGSLSPDYVEQSTKWAVRVLTANLLRVTRGAGKPHEITAQIGRLVEEMELYRHAFGRFPHILEYQEWLASKEMPAVNASETERWLAVESVIRGSLQITASRLVDQRTQESAGENQLHNGMRAYRDWQDRLRKEMLAAIRADAGPKKRPKAKPKTRRTLRPT